MSQNQRNQKREIAPSVVLTIEKKPTGEVHVNGPIDNLYVCYGLLELAKDAIRNHNARKRPQAPSSGIIVPQMHVGL